MSCVLSNAKRQRREPATDDVRFGSERNGWLRFAPPTSARCISYDAKLFRRTLWPNHGELLAIDSRPSDAIALALRTRAPIFVEDTVIDNAKTVDFSSDKADADRLHKWLESLDPDDLGKYKM